MKKVILFLGVFVLGVCLVVFLLSKTAFGRVKEEYDKNKETLDQVTEMAHQLSIRTWISQAEQKWVLTDDSILTITDPSYVSIKGEGPKTVEVYLNEQGTILEGTFTFEDGTYEYDGKNIMRKN